PPQPLFLYLSPATPPPQTYPLSLHDALPIFQRQEVEEQGSVRIRGQRHHLPPPRGRRRRVDVLQVRRLAGPPGAVVDDLAGDLPDRKSTRLNSSHVKISYAVFCLKKKKRNKQ